MTHSTREMSDQAWSQIGDPNISPKLKRLAGTIALLGVIFGVLALFGLLFTVNGGVVLRVVTPATPPSVISASLSFFAIGFGVIALWSVKQIPGKAGVRVVAVISLLLGLAGPPIFSAQAVRIHVQLQTSEVERAQALTNAALAFEKKTGKLPADLLELVQSSGLTVDAIKTAFGSEAKIKEIPTVARTDVSYDSVLRDFEEQSDFVYLAANIDKSIPADLRPSVILLRSKRPHMESQSAAVGFADGTARWISLSDAQQMYDDDSKARGKMGVATQPASRPALK